VRRANKNTVTTRDGACGFSSMEAIAKRIGLEPKYVTDC